MGLLDKVRALFGGSNRGHEPSAQQEADAKDADRAFEASQLDETFQMEQWGEDAEAAARRIGLHREIAAIARYAHLSRQSG